MPHTQAPTARALLDGDAGAANPEPADPAHEPCCDDDAHSAEGSPPCAGAPSAPAGTLDEAAVMFRALGDAARLAVLAHLLHGPCCVTDLAGALGERVSTVSQRLKVLLSARLVRRRRDGKHIFYTLADGHVSALIHNVLAHAAEDHHHR